jgi:hypothetical protein
MKRRSKKMKNGDLPTMIVIIKLKTCYYDESDDDMPIIDFMVPNDDFDNEYVLDIKYDNL